MANAIAYTPRVALNIPHVPPSGPRPLTVPQAFDRLLGALALLLRVEEAFDTQGWGGSVRHLDLDATTHGYAAVDAAARAVLEIAPAGPGDRALQTGAFAVGMTIGMEDPNDRDACGAWIDAARMRLMLEAEDPEARVVNPRLAVAFSRLDRLVALQSDGFDPDLGPEETGLTPGF